MGTPAHNPFAHGGLSAACLHRCSGHRGAQHLGPAAMVETGGMAASRAARLTENRACSFHLVISRPILPSITSPNRCQRSPFELHQTVRHGSKQESLIETGSYLRLAAVGRSVGTIQNDGAISVYFQRLIRPTPCRPPGHHPQNNHLKLLVFWPKGPGA
jgi:hypothetical protein